MSSPKLIVAFVLATALLIFGVQNTQSVTFHFLTFDAGPAPVIVAVFAGALVGAVLAWAVQTPARFRARRERTDLGHQLAAAKREAAAVQTETIEARRAAQPPRTPSPTDQSVAGRG